MRLRAGSLLALIGLGLAGTSVAQGATVGSTHRVQKLVRIDARPALPLFTAVDHPVPASTRMQLTIELKPSSAAALASEAAAVSDPASPDFHHYLSVKQFASRYGANADAIDAVSADLRASGMQVSSASANGLFLTVDGSAGQTDRAFHADLSRITLANGRVAYANLRAPRLRSDIARDVAGVIGLDDIAPAEEQGDGAQVLKGREHRSGAGGAIRPGSVRRSDRSPRIADGGGPQPCAAATNDSEGSNAGGGEGYTIDEQASAYQLTGLYGASDFGAGQTVGILELQAYNPTDVSTYFACYGISPTVNQVNVDGGPGAYNSNATDDGESAMDIEVVGGIAPKATIDVYEGAQTDTSWVPVLNAAVSADQAKAISSSIAICEPLVSASIRSSDQTLLEEAAAQGQSFYVASGDSGAESCSQIGESTQGWNSGVNVDEPGAQPYATAVGGTSMFTLVSNTPHYDWTGVVPDESVWNDGTNAECGCGGVQDDPGRAGGGSGGGLSADYAMPSYQQNAASSLGVINASSTADAACGATYCREVPDVSADGDLGTGYATYAQTAVGHAAAWTIEAGTSAAAPLWAGLTALVNADAQCKGRPVGFVNPALYEIAGTAYAANFNDPIYASPFSGEKNNDTLDQFGASSADPGFLYPSTTGYDMATGIGTPNGTALAASLCALTASDTVSVTNPGTQTTVAGTAVSLQIAGTSSSNAALNYSAAGLPAGLSISSSGLITGTPTTAGTSTVTVSLTDSDTASGSTTFTWIVNAPAAPSTPPASPSPPASSVPVASTPVATTPVTPPATATSTTKPAAAPTVAAAKLDGVSTGKPKLTFTTTAGAGNVKSVLIEPPSGLRFSKSAKALAKDVTVRASGKVTFTVSSTGRSLTIKLTSTTSKIAVSVASGALTESRSLRTEIRKQKVKTLKLRVSVVNSAGRSAAPAITVKV